MFTAVITGGRERRGERSALSSGWGPRPGRGRRLGECPEGGRKGHAWLSLGPPSRTCVFNTTEQVDKVCVGGMGADKERANRPGDRPPGRSPRRPPGAVEGGGPGLQRPGTQNLPPRGLVASQALGQPRVPARSGSGPRGIGGLYRRAREQGGVPFGPSQGRCDPAAQPRAMRAAWLRGAPRPAGRGAAGPGARAKSGRLADPAGCHQQQQSGRRGAGGALGRRGAGEEGRTGRGAGAPD